MLNLEEVTFLSLSKRKSTKPICIPESYRKLPKHIFKKKIQALLIVTLKTLDSYADISTLISEIKKASYNLIIIYIVFLPSSFPLLTNNVIKIDFF